MPIWPGPPSGVSGRPGVGGKGAYPNTRAFAGHPPDFFARSRSRLIVGGASLKRHPVNAFFTIPSQTASLRLNYVSRSLLPLRGPMAATEFSIPVLVALGPDRTVRSVADAAEAIACLSSIYWPRAGKRYWREAAHVCMQAWHGYRTAENARMAFIAAAEAADVLFVGRCEPVRAAMSAPVDRDAAGAAAI